MAQGDFTLFEEFSLALSDGTHDLDTHTIKVAFITNAIVPTSSDATPALLDYTECTAGGNYPAGGFTMTATLTEAGGVTTLDFTSNIAMLKDAGNPNNVAYALVYNDTATGDPAIGFLELKTTGHDGTGGAVEITWNDLGIITVTA